MLILAVIEYGYYKLAKRKAIGAPVCERSSHTVFTPTGGGVIFLAAALIFAVAEYHFLTAEWTTMLGGALVLGLISFVDDVRPLPAKPRLLVQVATIAVIFKQFLVHGSLDIYLIYLFCGVGCINAFNFIDGITGILALYATVVLSTLVYAVNAYPIGDATLYTTFGLLLISAIVIFALFNLSNKLFAGDVGSITIGVFIVWLLTNLIFISGDATLIMLIIVCIFDTGMTTMQRLLKGENILTPHRKHIYHILTYNWGNSHLKISVMYALLQFVISALYLSIPQEWHITYAVGVLATLSIAYIAIRKSPKSGKF